VRAVEYLGGTLLAALLAVAAGAAGTRWWLSRRVARYESEGAR
jgi:hypothetical protein